MFGIIPSIGAFAMEFDNGYIISDLDMTDYSSMSCTDVQTFLDRRTGTLATFTAPDKDGIVKTAAEIIWEAGQENKISPKFLLTMLQKEQSLVEDSAPKQSQYDWAMGYGVCDDCSVNDPAILLFKGFGTQVDSTAGANRWYIENTNNGWLKTPGKNYVIDGHDVTIKNQATANLYNFTPHIHGNYNFWKIWNSWFNQIYPDGTLLQAEGEQGIWLIKGGQRRPFTTKGALTSRYDITKLIVVGKNELEKYEIGKSIKFSNYSILESPSGNVYLVVDDKLRKFESQEVLRTLGFNPEEFEDITEAEVGNFEVGEEIKLDTSYPEGALLQDKITGGVFLVQDGYKYPIITKDILKINFPKYPITRVTPEELEKYQRLGSVRIKEGELVKPTDAATVYVISNETKRPIYSGEVFEKLGYKWKNIRVVDPKSLTNIPLGDTVDLDFLKN